MSDVLPGAEPLSHQGGPAGALVVHGFTGSPCSMRPIAEALVAEGYTVSLPRLPGHGTTISDMLETSWTDWAAAVEAAYTDLAAKCTSVSVIGLSMGGSLVVDLATRHPEIAALVPINALAMVDPEMVEQVEAFVEMGAKTIESIGNDIAKPDVDEVAYDETPLAPLLSMYAGVQNFQDGLPSIKVPTLLITSKQDHVVPPANSDHLADMITASPEQLWLQDSYHVATLDFDQERIIAAVTEFISRVSA